MIYTYIVYFILLCSISVSTVVYSHPVVNEKDTCKERLEIHIKTSAEIAFLLAKFQELDLEYEEAYINYRKAVFLSPNNKEYLEAMKNL